MKKVAMIGVGADMMAEKHDVVGYDVSPRTPTFPMKDTIREPVEGRDLIFITAPNGKIVHYGNTRFAN